MYTSAVALRGQYRGLLLQCVAAMRVAVCCNALRCVVVCCGALQCVAACCSVLQHEMGTSALALQRE